MTNRRPDAVGHMGREALRGLTIRRVKSGGPSAEPVTLVPGGPLAIASIGVNHSWLPEPYLDSATPEARIIGAALGSQLAGAHAELVSNDAAPANML